VTQRLFATSNEGNPHLLSHSHQSEAFTLATNTMPQYHTPTGTISYPDAKSSYPAFPKIGFGRAVVVGIGAGFLGAFVYVTDTGIY
jgi:hypothetical protein